MAINRFSEETYLLWANRIFVNLGNTVTIRTYVYSISPESLSSPFFQAHSFQFMCEASRGIPLSPLSPRCPFCPAEPWIPASPFSPFFPSEPRGPWVPIFPGLPRSPLAPSRPGAPGDPGTHVMHVHIPVCPPLLQDGHDWTGCKRGENLMTKC